MSTPVEPAPTLLVTTDLFGYPNNSGSPWHSDAQEVTKVLAKNGNQPSGVSPSLVIRSGSMVDQVQMTLTVGDQSSSLNKFGGDGGKPTTLTSEQLSSIQLITAWGTAPGKYDTQRLGQLTFDFTNSPSLTFGQQAADKLGSCAPGGGILLGFTGLSGSMVDGLSFLFAPSVS